MSNLLSSWPKTPDVAKARVALIHHVEREQRVLEHFARKARVGNLEDLKVQEHAAARNVAKDDLAFAQSVAKQVDPTEEEEEGMPPELLHSAEPEQIMLAQEQALRQEMLPGFGEKGRSGGKLARKEGAGRHEGDASPERHVSVLQERWNEQRHDAVSNDRKPTEGRLSKDFTHHHFGGDFAPRRLYDTCESAMRECKASCDFAPPMMGDPGMCACVSHPSGKTWTC